METVLELRNVSKTFPGHVAVDGVSLEVERGSFFALLGPSGCGKTTTLRMVAGFDDPTSGDVLLNGMRINQLKPYERNVTTVFQNYALFPHLTVRANVEFGLRRQRVADVSKRVADVLELVQLGGKEDRVPAQLSGGEKQRVALARSLVLQPEVLLLDEPLSALDPNLRKQVRTELKGLQRRTGITFLFVTHDQEEALSMSDRVAVMEKGRVLQVADPKTLYEKPVSRAVADFIGTMNFFEGRIVSISGGKAMVETEAFGRMEAQLNDGGSFSTGARVLIAIRPEKLLLSREQPNTPSARGQILAASYLGDRSQIQVRIPGREAPIAVVAQTAMAFHSGDTVHVSWTPGAPLLLAE